MVQVIEAAETDLKTLFRYTLLPLIYLSLCAAFFQVFDQKVLQLQLHYQYNSSNKSTISTITTTSTITRGH